MGGGRYQEKLGWVTDHYCLRKFGNIANPDDIAKRGKPDKISRTQRYLYYVKDNHVCLGKLGQTAQQLRNLDNNFICG